MSAAAWGACAEFGCSPPEELKLEAHTDGSEHQASTEASDVWAFAMILWWLVHRRGPAEAAIEAAKATHGAWQSDVASAVIEGYRPKWDPTDHKEELNSLAAIYNGCTEAFSRRFSWKTVLRELEELKYGTPQSDSVRQCLRSLVLYFGTGATVAESVLLMLCSAHSN